MADAVGSSMMIRTAALAARRRGARQVVLATPVITVGAEAQVLEANRRARKSMRCESAVEIISGAGQSLDEPAIQVRIAELSITWLLHRLHPLAAAQ